LPVVLAAVRAGETERSIAAVIEAAMREAGYERTAFDTIVASGPHSAMPHYRAGHGPLRQATWWCWTLAASWTDTAAT
jgi:Xaa-Pro aminopeptidase